MFVPKFAVAVMMVAFSVSSGLGAQAPVVPPPLASLTEEPLPPLVFSNNILAPVGDFPQAFALGDVDGDGKVDLATTGGPYLMLGDGHGRMSIASGASAAADAAKSTSAFARVAADFDGDGKLDLAFATGTLLRILRSAGPTGFVVQQSFPLSAVSVALCSLDADGDGDVDILLSSALAGPIPQPVYLLLNDGAGVFALSSGAGLPPGTGTGVAAGDVDHDGDVDAVIAQNNQIIVALNAGGVFGSWIVVPFASGPSARLRAARLDGDLFDDVVVIGPNYAPVALFGGASGAMAIGPTFPFAHVRDVCAIDLESDGQTELLFATDHGARLFRLSGGVPTEAGFYPMFTYGVSSADLDQDGDIDAVVEAGYGGVLSPNDVRLLRPFFNDGQGGLHAASPPLVSRPLVNAPAVADFDGDGDPDVLGVSDGIDRSLVLARNDGYGTMVWETPACVGCPMFGGAPDTVAVAALDFDGDGDLDLAVSHTPGGGISPAVVVLIANEGAAGFQVVGSLAHGGLPSALAAADVDADGDMDLISSDATPAGVKLYRNLGGSYAAPTALGVPSVYDLEAADFDQDGDIDIVCAANPSKLLLNDGGGTFTTDPAFPPLVTTRTSAWDVTQDGAPEVFLGGSLYHRTSSGAWILIGVVPGASFLNTLELVASDFDDDGDIDAYASSSRQFTALSGGVVQTTTHLVPPVSLEAVQLVDLDRDGGLDVLAPDASLLVNRTRRLRIDGALRPNRPTHVRVSGQANGAYYLFASLPPLGSPLAAPPFGSIFLDLPTMIFVDGGVLNAAGEADAAGFLPASFTALIGMELVFQAVVDAPPGPRLTNARLARIEGY